jgi:hypothetical protein
MILNEKIPAKQKENSKFIPSEATVIIYVRARVTITN